MRETGESMWTADRLAVHVRARLEDGRLFVVSNREPYMHVRRGKSIEVNVPASGLVTAHRACASRLRWNLGGARIGRCRYGNGGRA